MYMRFFHFFRQIWPFHSNSNDPKNRHTSSKTLDTASWLKGEFFAEMELFLRTQRSAHTQRAYRKDLEQFLGFVRAKGKSKLGLELVLQYRDYLVLPVDKDGLGLSHSSANRKFAALRAFFHWLEQRGKLNENPVVWVKNYRAKKESATQDFSDREVAKMLGLPSLHTRSGRMHKLMLDLLFHLGLRRSELAQLKASDLVRVRADDATILTLKVPGKGDKERLLPLTAALEGEVLDYLTREGLSPGEDRFIFRPVRNNFTKIKEKAIATQAVYYVVKKYARLAGVERRVSPHSCRATCISNALDQGATHRAVQDLAGWSSPLMLERYDKRRTGLKNSAVHLVQYGKVAVPTVEETL